MFLEIDRAAFRSIIQFYERHQKDIYHLEEQESLELNIIYIRSLFEVGSYQNFLKYVDAAIEAIIFNNILEFEGEDIYYELLFRKASALYHLHQFEDSAYICGQLIKINRDNTLAPHLLRKIYVDRKPKYLHSARATSLAMFLATAVFCAIELLLLTSVYESYQPYVEVVRISVFCAGIFILAGSQLFHFMQSQYRMEKMIR